LSRVFSEKSGFLRKKTMEANSAQAWSNQRERNDF
jgi:hypothetical protein